MKITAPISWPIAKLLDYLMGEHETPRFNNNQLKHLIDLHTEKELKNVGFESEKDVGLDHQQARIIQSTITLESLTIDIASKSVLIPVADIKMFSIDSVLNQDFFDQITTINYSRFPIYMGSNNIVAILMAK